jgi:hypothetical protein
MQGAALKKTNILWLIVVISALSVITCADINPIPYTLDSGGGDTDTDTDTDTDADIDSCDTAACSLTPDTCCPGSCDVSNDKDCCDAVSCRQTSDDCCPGDCSPSNDVDCCNTPCSQTPDECCPNTCNVGSDADCCEKESCSMSSDGCCPSKCNPGNDVDCCEDASCSASTDSCCPSKCEGSCDDVDCRECTSGSCCDTGTCTFSSTSRICDTWTEYQCTGTSCGDDAQQRPRTQYCSGDLATCDGNVVGSWATTPCGSDAFCETDNANYASCSTCTHGCSSGACWPDCNPSDNCCDPDGTTCDYGCDGTDCWPECNPSTDDCCELDGYACAISCNRDGICYLPMTDCSSTEGKYDPNSNLCWQDPPSATPMNWDDAVSYCPTLGSGWSLPTISELRSLFRGCLAVEWDLDWTVVPEDNCGVWDECLSFTTCHDGPCLPGECSDYGGPGTIGCYWDTALTGTCAERFWSLSEITDNAFNAWRIYFYTGNTHYNSKSNPYSVRCVRSE